MYFWNYEKSYKNNLAINELRIWVTFDLLYSLILFWFVLTKSSHVENDISHFIGFAQIDFSRTPI